MDALKTKTIKWDGETYVSLPFNKRGLMITTTISFLIGGIVMMTDMFIYFYYYRNHVQYAHELCKMKGFNNERECLDEYASRFIEGVENYITDNENFENSTIFINDFNNNSTNCTNIYLYTYTNFIRDKESAVRLFYNGILFGMFLMISTILAFNIKRAHHDWKKDMLVYILVNSLIINFN